MPMIAKISPQLDSWSVLLSIWLRLLLLSSLDQLTIAMVHHRCTTRVVRLAGFRDRGAYSKTASAKGFIHQELGESVCAKPWSES